jgi:hypothetical protein
MYRKLPNGQKQPSTLFPQLNIETYLNGVKARRLEIPKIRPTPNQRKIGLPSQTRSTSKCETKQYPVSFKVVVHLKI